LSPSPLTLRDLLADARARLAATPFGAPPREAVLLLGKILGLNEAQVLARDHDEIDPAAAARFREILERRLTGEPVAYLFGEREFYGRPFQVDNRVLIPRPETEHLIEQALAEELPPRPWILDVGTGSGILAVTLALEIPEARVVATDLSAGALAVAAGNARRLGAAERVFLVRTDLTAGLDLSRFDLVVSNPPYIDPADARLLSPEVCNFEPHLALFAPGSGDSVLARLFAAGAGLRSGVPLLVEIGDGQVAIARAHAEASPLLFERAWPDYAGIDRVLSLRRR
jgi:release factor glutamine methyltransferase